MAQPPQQQQQQQQPLQQQQNPVPMQAIYQPLPFRMPQLRAREAPQFDNRKPLGLERYFQELEHLLAQAHIADDEEKKKYAVIYLEPQDAAVFKSAREYHDRTKTYDEWKLAMWKYFPGSSSEQYCTLSDLRRLVEETQKTLVTQTDLGEFYRKFITQSQWLIGKNRLSQIEQGHLFLEAMPPILQSQVLGQLAVRNPDHVPDDPYTIEELYEAATLKLYGTSSANITPYVSHTSIIDG